MTRIGRTAAWIMMLAPPAVALGALVASCSVVGGVGTTTGHAASGSSGAGGSGGAAGTATGSGGGGGVALTGRSIFESTVQPGMLMECGSCHGLGGVSDAPFLAIPDVYVSITTWPGVIVSNPDFSVIITHPADPSHGGGQAPNMSAALKAKVLPWLTYEAAHLPVPDGGTMAEIPPFKPFLMGAFNAVYLDPLGMSFANSSVTFNADELPEASMTPTLLSLSNIQVHPIAGVSIHLVHPLFTVYTADGSVLPDPADSFSGFDETFSLSTAASDPTFGTGALVLAGWQAGARLGIGFETAEVMTTSSGTLSLCTDIMDFENLVVPQVAMWGCASKCHGGGNIMAQQQMDLSNIGAMPPNDACSQMRARITPGDPATSQILIVTNPTQGVPHGFKFAGNLNHYNSFKAAVTPWIQAEQ